MNRAAAAPYSKLLGGCTGNYFANAGVTHITPGRKGPSCCLIKRLGAGPMPAHETPAQKDTVERVMHEFKHGELKTARGTRKVKNRKQAIAIALHEAGASRDETPKKNASNLRRTKAKEARGETYRDAAEGRGRKSKSKSTSRRKTAGTRKAASAR